MAAWDEVVDFVCVGSGMGGCAGAVAAARAGLETLVLEKAELLGGSTTYSYGILWVPANHLARREGVEDPPEEGLKYMLYLGGGRAWESHVQAYVQYAPEALAYFEEVGGVRLYPVRGLPDHYFPDAPGSRDFGRNIQAQPFPASTLKELQPLLRHSPYVEHATFEEVVGWGGLGNQRNWDHRVLATRAANDERTYGAGLAGHFLKAAMDSGARIVPGSGVERLIVEDGRVRGVEVGVGEKARRIAARRGVLLATGSYGANPTLGTWFDETPPFATRRAPGSAYGDGLILAMEQGAALHVQHGTLAVHLAYRAGEGRDGESAEGREASIREVAAPHSLLVNRAGQRFADESNFEHVATQLRAFEHRTHAYANRPCYLVFDRQFLERNGFADEPQGHAPSWLHRGDTPAELAVQLGIDAQGLEATLQVFNSMAEEGVDRDFGRGGGAWARQVTGDLTNRRNPNLGPVCEPPFYGVELHATDTRSVGLVTSTTGQVMHVRNQPIEGLYACGEVAAQLHVGVGYQAGYTLTGAMTFAYLAVQQGVLGALNGKGETAALLQ